MKLEAPAAARNKEPIRQVLARYVPAEPAPDEPPVLEIASGSGEHAVYLARAFPQTRWQPTDKDPAALASISAWRAEAQLPNLLEGKPLDVTSPAWPALTTRLVVSINMIHIAPWQAALALFAGAERVLAGGGHLFLYGPFRFFGLSVSPSNDRFDESLRSRDPTWGVRDLAELGPVAARHGLVLAEVLAMPVNNHCIVFRKR